MIVYEKKRGAWEKVWTQVENAEGNPVLGEIVRPVLSKVKGVPKRGTVGDVYVFLAVGLVKCFVYVI